MSQVLIVDDDQEIRITLRMLLEDDDHEVMEAPHGEAALNILQKMTHPIIVLLDLMMPKLDGLAVMRFVRTSEKLKQHHYILMTARHNTLPLDILKLDDRIIPVIQKPFAIDEILKAIAHSSVHIG